MGEQDEMINKVTPDFVDYQSQESLSTVHCINKSCVTS